MENLVEFDFVWWLRSSQLETIAADYDAMAMAIGLKVESANRRVAVEAWLNSHQRWLLVFDDVTDKAHIQNFLPANLGMGKVIVTTRERIDIPLDLVRLEDWSSDEAMKFLDTYATGPREISLKIADQLFNVPLALDQAVAYMKAAGIDGASYLKLAPLEVTRTASFITGRL